jgi:hypothetical protein
MMQGQNKMTTLPIRMVTSLFLNPSAGQGDAMLCHPPQKAQPRDAAVFVEMAAVCAGAGFTTC